MGAALGIEESQNEGFIDPKSYELIEKRTDQNYGEISLMRDSKGNNVAIKEKISLSQKELEQDLKALKSKKDYKHQNLVTVYDYYVKSDDKFCSSVRRIIWILEYVDLDLAIELKTRRLQEKMFTKTEFQKIVYQFISCLAHLQHLGVSHGDLRAQSVFLKKVTGAQKEQISIKLADPTILSISSTFMQAMTGGFKKGYYLSPLLFQAYKDREWKIKHDLHKSDVFTLGLLLFEIAFLSPFDDVYDFETGKFKDAVLKQHLQKIRQAYGDEVSELISKMLIIEELMRPDFIALLDIVKAFDLPDSDSVLQEKNLNVGINQSDPVSRLQQQQPSSQQQQKFKGLVLQQVIDEQQTQVTRQSVNTNSSQTTKENLNLPSNSQNLKESDSTQRDSYMRSSIERQYYPSSQYQQLQQQQQQWQEEDKRFNKTQYIQGFSSGQGSTAVQGIQSVQGDLGGFKPVSVYQESNFNHSKDKYFEDQIEYRPSYLRDYKVVHQEFVPQEFQRVEQPPSLDAKYQRTEYQGSLLRQDYQIPSHVQVIIDEYKNPQYAYSSSLHSSDHRVPSLSAQTNQYQYNQLDQYPNSYHIMEHQRTASQQLNYPLPQNYQIISSSPVRLSQQQQQRQQQQFLYQPQQQHPYLQQQHPQQQQYVEEIQETYEDGSIYYGQKLDGKRHGHGKFYYADGGLYEGEWFFGRMEGLGTLYYPQGGLAYYGNWKDDKFNGHGTVYNENPLPVGPEGFDYTNFDNLSEYWVKYEGDFLDDNKEGTGSLFLSNNEKFYGQFKNDLVDGEGSFYRQDGSIIKGLWDQNRLIQLL